jgi:molybdenum cofactor cytidylyltransferase
MADLAAIVLAAGASRRFGAQNKLLVPIGDRPLVRRVVEEILKSGAAEVTVVTGCEAPLIESALEGLDVHCVHNETWQAGMGSSIACGVRALQSDYAGAFVVPADMPFLSASLFRELAATFQQHGAQNVIYPATATGEQRNPVLWPQRFFPNLAELSGQGGAKDLLRSMGAEAIAVRIDEAFLADVDTPEELKAYQRT